MFGGGCQEGPVIPNLLGIIDTPHCPPLIGIFQLDGALLDRGGYGIIQCYPKFAVSSSTYI